MRAASSLACSGSSGTATWPGWAGPAIRRASACATTPRATSRPWSTLAAGYAKMANRLATLACTSSIGPGATNMLTAAAGATINRLPVLLLPGDLFATRRVAPVLQQLEASWTQDVSVNDCFKPVSRYWDRINRPEQLRPPLLEAMRVLTSPAETGAVTLALPEDVQSEAFDFPEALFEPRVWHVRRAGPEPEALGAGGCADPGREAAAASSRAEASSIRRRPRRCAALAEATGIPVGETQAGKGALRLRRPVGPGRDRRHGHARRERHGARGRPRDRRRHALLGLHDRVQDRVPGSGRALRERERDSSSMPPSTRPAGGGATRARRLTRCAPAPRGLAAPTPAYASARLRFNRDWDAEVAAPLRRCGHAPLPSQAEVIGAVNTPARPRTSWCARPAACPATCTSSGARATPRAITSSTATRAWATRSRVPWA